MVKRLSPASGKQSLINPAYGGRSGLGAVPKFRLPDEGMEADEAYRLIHDELMLDGNARLNLATFVTTWMEPQAEKLMAEAFNKNMIDKDEYPITAKIEERCINMVARLFNAPEGAVGTSAIGSSEAVMLSGMAMKWRWRDRRRAAGKDTSRPNLVLGTNVQVVWEKFCRYWEVEPRYVPITPERFTVAPEDAVAAVDENTIGVVAILGTTFTGEYEPVEALHQALARRNEETGWQVPIHVDAASGGFVAPFLDPHLVWDFRLPGVVSINASGHKYGLVYPGVGWAVWRDRSDLPEDLVFHVNYLGGDMPTFTLNFSRPGNQIVAQYYNFLRLGHEGYSAIMTTLSKVAQGLAKSLVEELPFRALSDGSALPVFAVRLKEGEPYSVFDVSEKLRSFGWQVPAYTMPANAEAVAVLRFVIREGFSRDMAEMLLDDCRRAIAELKARPPSSPKAPAGQFSHG